MPMGRYGRHDRAPFATVEIMSDNDYGVSANIRVDAEAPLQVRDVVKYHIPVWMDLFQTKSREYGDAAFELGAKAQFVDMSRKMVKLRAAIWEDREDQLTTESVDEILLDLIGHCFLTLEMRRRAGKQTPDYMPITNPIRAQFAEHPGYTEDTEGDDLSSVVVSGRYVSVTPSEDGSQVSFAFPPEEDNK